MAGRDSKILDVSPLSAQFFFISCSFREILADNRLAPPFELAPPLGNPTTVDPPLSKKPSTLDVCEILAVSDFHCGQRADVFVASIYTISD